MEFSVLMKMQHYNKQPNKEKQIWFKIISVCLSAMSWPRRRPLRGILGTNLTALEIRNQQVWKTPSFLGKQPCGEKASLSVWPALKACDRGLNQQGIKGCSEVMPLCSYREELWAPPGIAAHPAQGAPAALALPQGRAAHFTGSFLSQRVTFWWYFISLFHTLRNSQHS